MKTTELGRKDQFTEPDEHETSSAYVTGNPASSEFLALVAQQPFFKGLSDSGRQGFDRIGSEGAWHDPHSNTRTGR